VSSDDQTTQEAQSFAELGLSDKVLSAVTDAGYLKPTPIQAGAIPARAARQGRAWHRPDRHRQDRRLRAANDHAAGKRPRTGSHAAHADPGADARTRRAGRDNFVKYGKNHKLTVALLIGGVSFDDQERKLERGADVLIATPGRCSTISSAANCC
jgi:superfamily II DNA/RNA helicase